MNKNEDSSGKPCSRGEVIELPKYLSEPRAGNPGWKTCLGRSKTNPQHYQMGNIQVWDFIIDQDMDFLLGNVIKYVCRAGAKPGESRRDDLEKAKVYIEKALSTIDNV